MDAEGRGAGPSRLTSNPPSQCERGFASQQLFCFAGKIQRDVGDGAVLAVPALGKADGVFRVVAGDIPLKGRRGLVFAAFASTGMISVPFCSRKSISPVLSE